MIKKVFTNRVYVLYVLIILQTIVIFTIYALKTMTSGNEIFLASDGYYEATKLFIEEGAVNRIFAIRPGVSVILSPLFLFPESLHPFLRVTISVLLSIGVLYFLYKITERYLNGIELFLGSLILIFNLTWIHWTLRLTPEIFLTFFLGLFIWSLSEFWNKKTPKWLIIGTLAIAYSITVKPVTLVVPVLVLFYALFREKRILTFSVFSLLLCIFAYYYTGVNPILSSNSDKVTTSYQKISSTFINEAYWYDFMLSTQQFHKGLKIPYEEGTLWETSWLKGDKFVEDYYNNHPEGNVVSLHFAFFEKHPKMVIQKTIMSPFIYLMLGTVPIYTKILIPLTLISLILTIVGLRKIVSIAGNEERKFIYLIFLIIIAFSLPYLFFHAYARYSMPVLPFLFIWGGAFLRLFKKHKYLADYYQTAHRPS